MLVGCCMKYHIGPENPEDLVHLLHIGDIRQPRLKCHVTEVFPQLIFEVKHRCFCLVDEYYLMRSEVGKLADYFRAN